MSPEQFEQFSLVVERGCDEVTPTLEFTRSDSNLITDNLR